MLSVHDVAAAILQRQGPMSHLKLQTLVYYSQAWHLAWYTTPLFQGELQADPRGPMSRELTPDNLQTLTLGNPNRIPEARGLALDAVLHRYLDKSPLELSHLAQSEYPWQAAREGIRLGMPCDHIISEAHMESYYRDYGGADLVLDTPHVAISPETLHLIASGDGPAIADYLGGHLGGRVAIVNN